MSGETGKQIRVTIPVAVFEQIDRTAAALGISLNELGARCVISGIGPAIAERIVELERSLAALKTEIAPPPAPRPSSKSKPADKTTQGEDAPKADLPTPQPGRAERAAAARNEQLAEERRRGKRNAA